jgi:hypothetical protein
MFLKLLHYQEEESDAKKRKLEKIASGSQEQNAPAENDQGQDGDQLANTRKSQTTVNFYKNKRERRFAFRFAVSSIPPLFHSMASRIQNS